MKRGPVALDGHGVMARRDTRATKIASIGNDPSEKPERFEGG